MYAKSVLSFSFEYQNSIAFSFNALFISHYFWASEVNHTVMSTIEIKKMYGCSNESTMSKKDENNPTIQTFQI